MPPTQPRRGVRRFLLLAAALLATNSALGFRVHPYLQNPSDHGMTILWISDDQTTGTVACETAGSEPTILNSSATLATALDYHEAEIEDLPGQEAPPLPYQHRVRFENLEPGTVYTYKVAQGGEEFEGSFRTAPKLSESVRFMVYADSETEPESTGKPASWPSPSGDAPSRKYIIDQTTGYAENLKVIRSRNPNFIAIAGDLVQSGGEQRDWDEFWRHNAGPNKAGSHIPILPAPGNHEYYAGPDQGGYEVEASNDAIAKYDTYFEVPENGAPVPSHRERYYRVDCGPVTLISLDSCNGLPNGSSADTNWHLPGEGEGGSGPDFNPGSRQYQWLQEQLADARKRSPFIFVIFHHVPYSVGPHGTAPGDPDPQSGRPMRVLVPLFMEYGVDAVFCGHDEMYEHSRVSGVTTLPNGMERPHVIDFWDIGIGGDGLRGPQESLANPEQVFLAHTDSPEIPGPDGSIADGGKHYGHLEVNVEQTGENTWQATITPVYVFPLNTRIGDAWQVQGFERRTYDDEVVITREGPLAREASLAVY